MRFVKDPFRVNVEADFALKAKELVISLDEASFQLKLIDIQSSDDLRHSLQLQVLRSSGLMKSATRNSHT